MSNKESFYYQTSFFSKYYRVIAIDITGFGKSKKLEYPYSISDYARDIKATLRKLKIDRYNLVAHSFGGRIALKLALMGEKINKLILVGSAGLKPRRSFKFYLKVLCYKIIKPFLSNNLKLKFGSSELKMLSGNMRGSYYKIVNEHFDSSLKFISVKTLIVYGKNDKETPIYYARRFKKNLKNSIVYIIKGAGHYCFLEKFNEFNYVALEFLRG